MIQLGCILARMSEISLPSWLTSNPNELASMYAVASSSDIQLKIDNRLEAEAIGSNAEVDAYALHEATGKLTQNSSQPARVKNIAILFARSYVQTQNVFGIMFDRGFTTEDDPNSLTAFTEHPREGCAVFIDTFVTAGRTTMHLIAKADLLRFTSWGTSSISNTPQRTYCALNRAIALPS